MLMVFINFIFSKGNITFTPGPHVLNPLNDGLTVDNLSVLVVTIGVVILGINIFICAFVIHKNKKVLFLMMIYIIYEF